jgi:hypothetical protein
LHNGLDSREEIFNLLNNDVEEIEQLIHEIVLIEEKQNRNIIHLIIELKHIIYF